jgi:DNA ligase-1
MLAQPFEEKRLNKWGSGPFIIQPKLDGDRCRAVIDTAGKVTLYSSEENIITSVPHINEQLSQLHLNNIEFDGELYIHGDNFEHIHSIVSRRVNQHYASENMQFHIFDVVTADPQIIRLRAAKIMLDKDINIHLESLQFVEWEYVSDLQSILEQMHRYKDSGYEGIILRHPKAPYVRKRSPYMMKFKPKKSDIYEIIGYQEEISIHNIPKGRLGAFLLRGDDGTIFKVGSGFNDEQRMLYWKSRELMIGKWCEVQYQSITSKEKVPRFPIFIDVKEEFGGLL